MPRNTWSGVPESELERIWTYPQVSVHSIDKRSAGGSSKGEVAVEGCRGVEKAVEARRCPECDADTTITHMMQP